MPTDIERSLFDNPFEDDGLLGESGRPRDPVTVETTGSNPVQVAKPSAEGGVNFDVHRLRNGHLMLVYHGTQRSEEFVQTETPETAGVLFRYQGAWYTTKK